jgi:Uma2 family endonuclease
MSTATRRTKRSHPIDFSPQLVNGDRMSQAEFHRRYETYPEDIKFELIGGIVFMASPLRRPHAVFHGTLSMILRLYSAETPGAELMDNGTTILGEESEPQPDLSLRIRTEYGGQSRETEDHYIKGPPELVAEIAHSTRSIDLHLKRQDYERAGVKEYLILSLEGPELLWFDFVNKGSINPDRLSVARSRAFPGLWIHVAALLGESDKELIATVSRGVKSPAHKAFVKRLQARRRSKS